MDAYIGFICCLCVQLKAIGLRAVAIWLLYSCTLFSLWASLLQIMIE